MPNHDTEHIFKVNSAKGRGLSQSDELSETKPTLSRQNHAFCETVDNHKKKKIFDIFKISA